MRSRGSVMKFPRLKLGPFVCTVSFALVGCTEVLGDFHPATLDAATIVEPAPEAGPDSTSTPEAGAQDASDPRDRRGDAGCTVGSKLCRERDLLSCAPDGTWQTDFTCPFLCAAGACTGLC